MRKNIVRQYGPSRVRDKKRLDSALEVLQTRGVIQINYGQGGHLINLSPSSRRGTTGYVGQGRSAKNGF